jgi:hypothetical protein
MPHVISAMSQLLQRSHATNATSMQCRRDCSDVAEIAAMSHLLHAITAMSHLSHATNATSQRLQTLKSTTVRVLENTPEREAGLKVCPKCFFTTLEQIYYYYVFRLSHKEEMRRGTEFFTAKCVSSRQL